MEEAALPVVEQPVVEQQTAAQPPIDFHEMGRQSGHEGVDTFALPEEVARYIDPDEDTELFYAALEEAQTGLEQGRREHAIEQGVTIYTDAPESYDGHGTFTLDTGHGETNKGPIRRVVIHPAHLKWHLTRFDSGMYMAATTKEFEEIKDLFDCRAERKEHDTPDAETPSVSYTIDVELKDWELEDLPPCTEQYDNYRDIHVYTFERELTPDEQDARLLKVVTTLEDTTRIASEALQQIKSVASTYNSDAEVWVNEWTSDKSYERDYAVDHLSTVLRDDLDIDNPPEFVKTVGELIVQLVQGQSRSLPLDEIRTALPQRMEDRAVVVRELMRLVLDERAYNDLEKLVEYNDEQRSEADRDTRPLELGDSQFMVAAKLLGDEGLMGARALVEYVPSVNDVAPAPSKGEHGLMQGVLYARTSCGRRPAIIYDAASRVWLVADPDRYLQQFPGRFVQVGLWETVEDDKGRWNN